MGQACVWLGATLALVALRRHLAGAWADLAAGLPHAVIYTALLAAFGRSLRPGRCDRITDMARRVQPGFSPAMARHTRAVCWAWCGFFAAQLLASVLLRAFAPPAVWGWFVTAGSLPLVALMFMAEYAVRLWRFPGHARVSLAATARAFRASWRGTPPSPADQGGQQTQVHGGDHHIVS